MTKRLIRVLFSMLGMRAGDSVMHSDTLTLTLMSLSYCLLVAKLDIAEKVLHEKGKRRELSM